MSEQRMSFIENEKIPAAGMESTAILMKTEGAENIAALPMSLATAMHEDIERLGGYVAQMGIIISALQRRVDEMEARQAAVTIRHEDVKRLQTMMRVRADQICEKYGLQDPESAKIFRAAIKKELLKRYGVKDLHDIPAHQLPGAENMVGGWTNIRLAMERRAKA